jgi:gamma-glutamylcyclotransferase (GGCT)/AIG2-like uncharacterized protein YtfP
MSLGEIKMPLYFTYGSNLDVEQMRRRCPESKVLVPGFLRGYRLDFRWYSTGWDGGVADVVLDSEKVVWGVVYELTMRDLELLDSYEGYPKIYTRFQVSVETSDGTFHDVWVYAVVNKKPFIPPTRQYLAIIKRGAEQFGFPEDYRSSFMEIRTQNT